MRILYGVQGTGNGHSSRARAMVPALARRGCTVDYLFSGRSRDRFFDMQPFGNWMHRKGLTFVSRDGRVDYLRSVLGNDFLRFVRDVWALDLAGYDLVITDFEPVTAWAGRIRGKTVISMGHQPAFDYPVPTANRDIRSSLVMKVFAPAKVRIGMHWDAFDAPLLPPLIELEENETPQVPGKVLVYLPFENQERVQSLLSQISDHEFFVYAPGSPHEDRGSLRLRPTSVEGFRADLRDCSAVLCNAGFELSSECLALGKRLLVKPQGQQMEQASNALALQQLGYGEAMEQLDKDTLLRWLRSEKPGTRLRFPDVADALAEWIQVGDYGSRALRSLSTALWSESAVLPNRIG